MKFTNYGSQMAEKGLDVAWLKMRVTANNIANYSTPGYKAKQVSFEETLRECESPLHGGQRVQNKVQAVISTDENTEARVDGNNVSMEKEQIEQWKAQAQYSYLIQKVSGHYSTIRNTISQFGK